MVTAISSAHIRARFSITVLLFSSVVFAAERPDLPELNETQIQTAIDHVLEERHPTDTPEWWRSLGPRAPSVIEQRLQTTTQVYPRLRLVQALGHFTDPAGLDGRVATLKQIAQQTSDDVIRHAAIRSVADASGGREVEWIAGYLAHADGQTRRTAALVLKQIGTELAREKIAEFEKRTGEAALSPARPAQPLTKSGTSLDQPSPEWDGEWKGFWIEPGRVTPGRLTLDAGSAPQKWNARLVLGKKQSVVRLETTRIQGSVATGQWTEQVTAPTRPAVFEARLELEGRHRVVRIRVPERAGTLVLFR